MFCFYMLEVILSFRSLRTRSQVLALLMLFLCVILYTMSSGKGLQLICIFPFGMLCLSAITSVYSLFSDRVGLPLHNIISPFLPVMDIFSGDLN